MDLCSLTVKIIFNDFTPKSYSYKINERKQQQFSDYLNEIKDP